MTCFLFALIIVFSGGLLSLIPGLTPNRESVIHTGITFVGCVIALFPVVQVLLGAQLSQLNIPWSIPEGRILVAIDPLSALFLLLHFVVSGASVIFGYSYFKHYEGERSLRSVHFFFSSLIVFIALVLTAQNGIMFLVAWEIMALSSFFLIIFDGHKTQVRNAGFLYLASTHVATLCIFVVFILLDIKTGSFDFDKIAGSDSIAAVSTAVFVLSLIGFGSKAGFMPLHIWLPEAHPAAPSPVSGLMSGVVIKTGIYGLIRILSFYKTVPSWWGFTLGAIGVISGVLGILWALAQSDFKRLLAYSSIENIGIITMGLGIGYLGLSFQNPVLAMFGFGGALLHVINHGLFKSLLFLGAGSVLRATGNLDIEKQGGLMKKMPLTGLFILIGSVAICGLPPLNGFISEWLIYYGAFHLGNGKEFYILLGAPVLALIGALAVTCFTKVFGIQFLGSARSSKAANAVETDMLMTGAMGFLAICCCLIGLFPSIVLPVINSATAILVPDLNGDIPREFTNQAQIIFKLNQLAISLIALILLLILLRGVFLSKKSVTSSSTWGCGYAFGSAKQQYTSSSFVQFPVALLKNLLHPVVELSKPEGYFPEEKARFASSEPDLILDRFLLPLFRSSKKWFLTITRRLQHGRIHLYLVYMFIFMVILFLWKL